MGRDIAGRVIITWPAASPTPTALPVWGCAFEDPDTGEQLLDVAGFALQIGADFDSCTCIEVELTRLVDAEGNPIGPAPNGRLTLTEEYLEWQSRHMADADPTALFPGQRFRAKTFRYTVAEMRIAASRPGVDPKVSVGVRTGPTPGAVQLPPTVIPAPGDGAPTDQYGRALPPRGEVYGGTHGIPIGGRPHEDGGPELFIPDGAPRIVSDGGGPEIDVPQSTGHVHPSVAAACAALDADGT